MNQQIEKLKELQSDAKPQHVKLLEDLFFSISISEFSHHYTQIQEGIPNEFDLELAFRKLFQKHFYSLEAIKNKHPVFVKINDDEWIQKWLIKLLYYGRDKKKKVNQQGHNKYQRFLKYLFNRLKRIQSANQEDTISHKVKNSLQILNEDDALQFLNQYKKRKQHQESSRGLIRIDTQDLSEYFDDDFDVKVQYKDDWIKSLRSESDFESSESEMTRDCEEQQSIKNAVEFARMAQRIGIIKGREQTNAFKQFKKRKTFYGKQCSSSSEDNQTIVAEKLKSTSKLDQIKQNLQTVMSQYNINQNKITYNLTESEKDLKLRQMQRSQSSFNLRNKVKVLSPTNYQTAMPQIQVQHKPTTALTARLQTTMSTQKSVKLQSVSPRKTADYTRDYLKESRLAKQPMNQQIEDDATSNPLSSATSQRRMISNNLNLKKVSNLRFNIQKLIQKKRLTQADQRQNYYASAPQGIEQQTSQDLKSQNDQQNRESANQIVIDSLNKDIFLHRKYKHFHQLLPFNIESEQILKDIDQLAIKFNYFELVLIAKRIFKLTNQHDFYQSFRSSQQK